MNEKQFEIKQNSIINSIELAKEEKIKINNKYNKLCNDLKCLKSDYKEHKLREWFFENYSIHKIDSSIKKLNDYILNDKYMLEDMPMFSEGNYNNFINALFIDSSQDKIIGVMGVKYPSYFVGFIENYYKDIMNNN